MGWFSSAQQHSFYVPLFAFFAHILHTKIAARPICGLLSVVMKKLLFALLLLPFFFAFFLKVTNAQSPAIETPTQPAKVSYPLNTNPDVPQNFHTYSQSVLIELLAGAACMMGGVDVLSQDGRCLGVDSSTGKIGYVNSTNSIGLVGVMGNLISSTYNLPASTGTYVQYLASNFGVTRTSYAELGTGIGYEGLKPVLNIWKVFRNLSYIIFILIFVLIGLGIMFRLNIDARAVMTVQNQLPKIVLALILISLSYAIAGLLIDMMYMSIYLIVNLFNGQSLATVNNMSNPINAIGGWGGPHAIATPAAESVAGMFKDMFEGTLGGRVSKWVETIAATFLTAKAGGGIGALVGGIAGGAIGSIVPGAGTLIGVGVGTQIGGIAGQVIGGAVGIAKGPSILEFVAGMIVYIILTIAIFQALFRTWFLLIKAYVFLLLDVIFAPLFIMAGLLPGSPGGGFGSWVRSLLGNLAAFPTVLTLFLIGSAIQGQLKNGADVGNFIPPLVGTPGDDSVKSIGSLIGLGIILIMPESVNLAKAMFKSPERKLASAVWQPIGLGTSALTSPIKGAWGKVWGEDRTGKPKYLSEKFDKFGKGVFKGIMNPVAFGRKIKTAATSRSSTGGGGGAAGGGAAGGGGGPAGGGPGTP